MSNGKKADLAKQLAYAKKIITNERRAALVRIMSLDAELTAVQAALAASQKAMLEQKSRADEALKERDYLLEAMSRLKVIARGFRDQRDIAENSLVAMDWENS